MHINSEFQPIKCSHYKSITNTTNANSTPKEKLWWLELGMQLYRLKNYYRNEEKHWCKHTKEEIYHRS